MRALFISKRFRGTVYSVVVNNKEHLIRSASNKAHEKEGKYFRGYVFWFIRLKRTFKTTKWTYLFPLW